ncbi:MAG TPA: hypothetical protein VJU85_06070, partial [Nitrososphaeraceae archaeon]|nr:hypothetical protein [Nitrososphaeraceae archaeon]
MGTKGYIKSISIFIAIAFALSILYISSSFESSFAQKNDKEEDKDKLIVKASINLKNVDMNNTMFIRLIGFINGEEVKQDIPISSIDKTKNKLDVDLKVNKKNDIVEASTPDEFFVCAYEVGDVKKNYNSLTKFDCNEGDILSTSKPTPARLFQLGSHVYEKTQAVYGANINNTGSDSNIDKVKIKILAPLADRKDTKKLIIAAMIKGQIQSEVIED